MAVAHHMARATPPNCALPVWGRGALPVARRWPGLERPSLPPAQRSPPTRARAAHARSRARGAGSARMPRRAILRAAAPPGGLSSSRWPLAALGAPRARAAAGAGALALAGGAARWGGEPNSPSRCPWRWPAGELPWRGSGPSRPWRLPWPHACPRPYGSERRSQLRRLSCGRPRPDIGPVALAAGSL